MYKFAATLLLAGLAATEEVAREHEEAHQHYDVEDASDLLNHEISGKHHEDADRPEPVDFEALAHENAPVEEPVFEINPEEMVVCDNGKVYECHPDIGQCYPNSAVYCDDDYTEHMPESLEAGDVAAEAEAEENYHWETGLVNDDETAAANDHRKEDPTDGSKPGDEEEEEAPYGVDGNWNDEPEGYDPDADWFDDLPTDSEDVDPNGDYEDLVYIDGYFYHKEDVEQIFHPDELAALGELQTFDEMPDPEAYYDQDDEEAEDRLWGFFHEDYDDSVTDEEAEAEAKAHEEELQAEYKLERQNAMVFEEEDLKDLREVTLDEVFEAEEDMDDEWDEATTAGAQKEVLEQNDNQLFLVMFTMLAAMLFIMWLMLRNCQKNSGDEEEENKRKRGSYVPTRISAVADDSVELKDVEAYV